MRDIIQFDKTVDDSINRITTAHRTCDLILGVGDGKVIYLFLFFFSSFFPFHFFFLSILSLISLKKLGYFRGFQYSHSVANVIDDENLGIIYYYYYYYPLTNGHLTAPVNSTWHPQIENVVYWGMDWLCPGYTEVLSKQLQKYHGNITAENTIQFITAITQTGDLRIILLYLFIF